MSCLDHNWPFSSIFLSFLMGSTGHVCHDESRKAAICVCPKAYEIRKECKKQNQVAFSLLSLPCSLPEAGVCVLRDAVLMVVSSEVRARHRKMCHAFLFRSLPSDSRTEKHPQPFSVGKLHFKWCVLHSIWRLRCTEDNRNLNWEYTNNCWH